MRSRSRRHNAAATCMLTLLTLSGCLQEAIVKVTRRGDLITFAVTGRGSEPPCITGLSVTRAGTDIKTTPAVWDLATSDPERCRATFIYGEVPSGWSQNGPAPKLAEHVKYGVDATGIGVVGGGEFTMRAADGVLTDN